VSLSWIVRRTSSMKPSSSSYCPHLLLELRCQQIEQFSIAGDERFCGVRRAKDNDIAWRADAHRRNARDPDHRNLSAIVTQTRS
jgi:hypothetical protein